MIKKKLPLGRLLLALVPILAAVCGLVVYALLPKEKLYLLEGNVEAASTACYSKVDGTVKDLLVQAGQPVQKGEVLAVIDDSAVDRQVEQLLLVLEMKQAQMEQLKRPSDREAQMASRRAAQDHVTLWEETLAQARRELAAARQDLDIRQQLYDAGAISRAELRQYEQAADLADSQVKTTKAQLSAAKNQAEAVLLPDADEHELAAARAEIGLTELQIRQLEDSREDYKIRSATDGVVISTGIETGCTVVSGQNVFRVSNGGRQYFVCYLPQEYLEQVAFGDELPLFRQGESQEAARGIVTYMDLQAAYPPEDYENSGNRNKRSVKIKAELTGGGPFAVGQELVLRLAAVQE